MDSKKSPSTGRGPVWVLHAQREGGTKALQKIVCRNFLNESDNDYFSAIYKKRKLPAMFGIIRRLNLNKCLAQTLFGLSSASKPSQNRCQ